MKILIALVTLASFAFAGERIQYQYVGGVPANNVCDNGSEFLTINPVKVCVQWHHTPSVSHGEYEQPAQWTCQKYQMQHLSISKVIDVCEKFVSNEQFSGCTKMGKGIQGNKVVGERVREHGEASTVEYFDYYIKACPLD